MTPLMTSSTAWIAAHRSWAKAGGGDTTMAATAPVIATATTCRRVLAVMTYQEKRMKNTAVIAFYLLIQAVRGFGLILSSPTLIHIQELAGSNSTVVATKPDPALTTEFSLCHLEPSASTALESSSGSSGRSASPCGNFSASSR